MSSRVGFGSDVVARALARPSPFPPFAWKRDTEPQPAAVVVPIAFEPEPTVFAVLRSAELRDHAGEVGYPGGKPEASDHDLRATALRELEEEVDVELRAVLGVLSPVPVVTGRFLIHPFVAEIGPSAPVIRASEIAAILPIPLTPYLTGAITIEAVHTRWGGLEFLTPHFHLPAPEAFADGAHDGAARRAPDGRIVLYGASAFVLWELLLRIAAELGDELPAPTIVETRPWGDRYGSRG